MQILAPLISWYAQKRKRQIDFFKSEPIKVQQDVFSQLIKTARNTHWGKQHHYNTILQAGVKEFQKRVAIQDYESLKPYIERSMQGEKHVLWTGETKWFAKSSGTTGDKSKFIPVTKEALQSCHYQGGKDLMAIYLSQNPNSKMFSGKSMSLGGSHEITKFNKNAHSGDLSAILMQNLPAWARYLRTPELSIALMSEWEEKLDRMAETTIKEDVISIAGVPSWTLVLIKHILKKTGKTNLMEVWENLELFVHGGVSFLPYREEYERLINSKSMNYIETYNASEGFFGMQDELNADDMLLMLDYGVFYEFVPLEDLGKDNHTALLLDDVEVGKNYAVIISTNGGLWRYTIGDTVKFTSKYPFKIKISGRTKHFINAFGEELMIDNAEKALKEACAQTQAVIKEYTAAPIFMSQNSKGGHEWLVEFSKMPTNLELFTEILDKMLKTLNSDYEAKRYKDISLTKPKLQIAKTGLFYRWLKQKGKLGGQNKVPRLSNTRKYMDELVRLNEN